MSALSQLSLIHISEPTRLGMISYAVFCLKKKKISLDPRGLEAAADWSNLKSPETYVDYARVENFASPGDAVQDVGRVYSAPAALRLNQWSLVGNWKIG